MWEATWRRDENGPCGRKKACSAGKNSFTFHDDYRKREQIASRPRRQYLCGPLGSPITDDGIRTYAGAAWIPLPVAPGTKYMLQPKQAAASLQQSLNRSRRRHARCAAEGSCGKRADRDRPAFRRCRARISSGRCVRAAASLREMTCCISAHTTLEQRRQTFASR